MKTKNNYNKPVEMKILSVIDQRVLAVKNLISLWRQNGLTRRQALDKAENECFDAYLQLQLHEANGFKLGQE